MNDKNLIIGISQRVLPNPIPKELGNKYIKGTIKGDFEALQNISDFEIRVLFTELCENVIEINKQHKANYPGRLENDNFLKHLIHRVYDGEDLK